MLAPSSASISTGTDGRDPGGSVIDASGAQGGSKTARHGAGTVWVGCRYARWRYRLPRRGSGPRRIADWRDRKRRARPVSLPKSGPSLQHPAAQSASCGQKNVVRAV